MKEDCYPIKEAAQYVGVEPHVLRYWEEELKMDIHRNELGHRYYIKKDIEVLKKVKELKNRGLQLKAIRNYLEMRKEQIQNEKEKIQDGRQDELREKTTDKEIVSVTSTALSNEEKMEQFQKIMNRIVADAIAENKDLIGQSAGEHAADAVATKLNGMSKEQEEQAEARFKKLDQTLREIQQARLEAAAANMRPVDKRRQARMKRTQNKNQKKQAEANRKPDENA